MKGKKYVRLSNGFFRRGRGVYLLPCSCLFCALLLVAACTVFSAQAGEWEAPALADTLKPPVPADSIAIAAAQKTFQKNCSVCHGATGRGDGMMAAGMQPPPVDFTDYTDMSEQSDGELFWKISTGNKPMPAWKNELTEAQIWGLVAYLRTFVSLPTSADTLQSTPSNSLKH